MPLVEKEWPMEALVGAEVRKPCIRGTLRWVRAWVELLVSLLFHVELTLMVWTGVNGSLGEKSISQVGCLCCKDGKDDR